MERFIRRDIIVTKKDVETGIVKKFLSHDAIGISLDGLRSGETPDFRVRLSETKVISIEQTRIINPNLKKKEALQNKVVKLAEEQFLRQYGESDLRVLVTFSNHPLDTSENSVEELVNMVCQFVIQIYEANRHDNFHVTLNHRNRPNKYIERLTVQNDLGFSVWQTFDAYRVPYVEPSWFVDKIRSKEKGLMKYKDKFNENWLLLVSHLGSESSAFRFETIQAEVLNSAFDKVFVFEYMANEVLVVKG